MKGVKLSNRIRYIDMKDDQGPFGLMMLMPKADGDLPKTVTIESERQFVETLNLFRVEESYA